VFAPTQERWEIDKYEETKGMKREETAGNRGQIDTVERHRKADRAE
jgi:hypothetical protein